MYSLPHFLFFFGLHQVTEKTFILISSPFFKFTKDLEPDYPMDYSPTAPLSMEFSRQEHWSDAGIGLVSSMSP